MFHVGTLYDFWYCFAVDISLLWQPRANNWGLQKLIYFGWYLKNKLKYASIFWFNYFNRIVTGQVSRNNRITFDSEGRKFKQVLNFAIVFSTFSSSNIPCILLCCRATSEESITGTDIGSSSRYAGCIIIGQLQ